jgi:signal transduction histidine kinase
MWTARTCVSIVLALAALGAAPGTARAQTGPPRTVLTIHWGSEHFPGTSSVDAAIRSAVLSNPRMPVNYFAEYLESEDFPVETASIALRDAIRLKFRGRRIDLVITNASGALQFAVRFREELFPGVPIVFIGVAVPQIATDPAVRGITGVVRDTAFVETGELALQLHPSTTQMFVVAQAPTVRGYDQQIRSALQPLSHRVQLTYITEPTLEGLIAAVKTIPPRSLVLYTRYAPQESTRITHTDEIARLLADISPVPIYVASEVYVGTGVVGGMTRALDGAGRRAGEVAMQILAGRPVEEFPIERLAVVPTFDWRQIQRWGIDASKLPRDSVIFFKTPTLWEAYRGPVTGAIVIVGAQLALIAGLLTQRARRRRAEATIRAREASLRTSYQRIRQLAGRLIRAQETARASLAQDLHDDICQRLASVSLSVDHLKHASGDIQSPVAQDALAELAHEAHGAFDGIRRLSHELHPASLRVLGLAPALKAHCAEIAKKHDVEIAFAGDGDVSELPDEVGVCLFRIAQEAIRNGIAHGGARRLSVSLTRPGRDVEMTVTDDGRGFDLDAVRHDGDGLGLVSIEERAHVIGGAVEIVSGVEQGTTIRVIAPAAAAPQPAASAR